MTTPLQKLYKNILDYCSMAPNAEGVIKVSFSFDKEADDPILIDGKNLVMPTEAQLRSYHPEKKIVFHPLQEFINRGESDVVKALRSQLNTRINFTILAVASGLLDLVASTAEHKKLTPEQRELLLQVKSGDLTLPARFTTFAVSGFKDAPSRYFASIYLKKAGIFKGESHARVGVVRFPFMDLFEASDKELKLKNGDSEIFKSLFEFMFPGCVSDQEAYNSYSDNRDAPWLDCLLKTSYNLAQRLNELIELYEPFIENANDYLFNVDWVDAVDNIEMYRSEIQRIPSQKGNEGSVEVKTPARAVSDDEASTTLPAPRVNPQAPTYQRQPVPHQQPVANVQQVFVDQYGRIVNQPQPQQGYPQPNVSTNPPTLEYTPEGKLDFRSLSAVNPLVAAAGMISTPITEWQMSQAGRLQQGYGPQVQMDPRLAPSPNAYPQRYGQAMAPGYPNRRGGLIRGI